MIDPGSAIVTTGLLATLGWLYAGRQQRILNRRQHTYQIILRQMDDESFDKTYLQVSKIARAARLSGEPPVIDKTVERDLDFILDYYEFMCAAIWCGDIDEVLIKRCERSRVIKLHNCFSDYIAFCRTEFDQQTMWENFSKMAARWERERNSLLQDLVEYFILRPAPRDFYSPEQFTSTKIG